MKMSNVVSQKVKRKNLQQLKNNECSVGYIDNKIEFDKMFAGYPYGYQSLAVRSFFSMEVSGAGGSKGPAAPHRCRLPGGKAVPS